MPNDLLTKGRLALEKGEWEKAKECLEEALRSDITPNVLEQLAWACWWLNDSALAFEYRTRGYNLFLEEGDKLGAARNACWIGVDYIEFKGEFAIASGWFKRAESLLEGLPESWEHGLMKILKARWAFQADKNLELAFKLLDESLSISKSHNYLDGEMLAEAVKGFILVVEGNISEGMPLLDEATLLATTSEKTNLNITTITCCFLIDACERIRDYERASQWCNNVKEICERWRFKAMFANCKMKYAGILIQQGKWKDAEDELLSAVSELKKFRPAQINACTVRLADLKRRQGKWNEAEKKLSEVDSHPLKPLYYAHLFFDKGEYDKALEPAEKYLRRISEKEKAERTTGVELLLRIYIKLGKLEQAQKLVNELRDIAGNINTLPLKAALLSAEGNLNSAHNNNETAKQNFEDAADLYDKIKLPFEASVNRISLSEVLIKLNRFAQAEGELNNAMLKLKELGAEKEFEKARSLLKNLYKDKADDSDINRFEFTGRELEVLRLIAEGKNNEEIAEKLFLSIRTIEKHITNIYSKMGISGKSARAYAASYAIKHKLIFT
jgi:ATP/maltotriose-dependent transcriptional regulator MalT